MQQLHFIDTLSKLYMLFLLEEKLKSVWHSEILFGSPLYSEPAATVSHGAPPKRFSAKLAFLLYRLTAR